MCALITDIKQLRKRRPVEPVVETGNNGSAADVAEESVIEHLPTDRLSLTESALSRMAAKNPALTLLVSTLDLELVGVNTAPGHARLWELAGKALGGNRTYSIDEVISRIQQSSMISRDRAEKGFAMMVESKAIESTIDWITGTYTKEQFYLGGSTPF